MFGDLRIGATPRGGAVGPFVGASVAYHWPWYWHLPRLAPWALLALAVGVPRRNRDRRAILIFIPLAILSLAWPMIVRHGGIPSATAGQFDLLFESLVAGLALLWLNADAIRRRPALVRVPASLALLLLAGVVINVSPGLALSEMLNTLLLILIGILGAILLAALALARRLTRRRYAPFRFMAWLALGSLLIATAGIVVYVMFGTFLIARGPIAPTSLLLRAVVMGLVLGLCLYAVNLPYMLLMFTSPFFRRRFQAWLGVGSLLPPSADAQSISGQ